MSFDFSTCVYCRRDHSACFVICMAFRGLLSHSPQRRSGRLFMSNQEDCLRNTTNQVHQWTAR